MLHKELVIYREKQDKRNSWNFFDFDHLTAKKVDT